MSSIIALSGRAGSGKTTAAKYLRDKYYCTILSFAQPLKDFLVNECGYPREYVVDPLKKETIPPGFTSSARTALQKLGTEWGREVVQPDVWVNNFLRRASYYELVCCDDVRYDNEAQALKERGALIWRINGKNQNEPINHPSELGISTNLIDLFIDNTQQVEQLYIQLDNAIRNYTQ